MATYDECLTVAQDANLQSRMRVACLVAAETIRTEGTAVANHTNRLIWAKQAFQNPVGIAAPMVWAVVIQNRSFTAAQITGASDATLQTAVNAAVDVFATGS